MDLIIGFLHQGLSAILPLIILLGLLIFVHEMGHFLVAKYFGVRVEVFSLGFGKKIYQFKRGDTTYCISIFPLGGYVKMFGDEPGGQVAEDQKRYSFSHKPVGQRVLVVLAGPLMNFFFAIVLFAAMATVGEQKLRPVLGDVPETSQAYRDGFRSGDQITQVDGHGVHSWDEVSELIETKSEQNLPFIVQRGSVGEVHVTAIPKLVRNSNLMSTRQMVGEIEGLSVNSKASVVAVRTGSNPESATLAERSGFKTGDEIESINGTKLSAFRELAPLLKAQAEQLAPVQFKVMRANEKDGKPESKMMTIVVPEAMRKLESSALLAALGFDQPDLYLGQVKDKSPAKDAGLMEGDRILAISGHAINKWDEVIELVKSFKAGQGPIEVVVDRHGEKKSFAITPQMKKQMTPQGKEEERFILGIVPTIMLASPETFIERATGPIAALDRGLVLTVKWTKLTVLGFVRLIENEVSPKNIGGVISIAQVASRSFEAGLSAFLSIMAIISINLFVVNLLPVPVLDGGHLLFYSLEAIRGKPLSLKKLEMAQQVGLILLISLMAFALFNDFSRSLNL